MVGAQARQYIANKLDEQAKLIWQFNNLHYSGEISVKKPQRVFSFGEISISLKPNGDLWIEGANYRNYISADSYTSAQECVNLLGDQLRYIDQNYQRIQSEPEFWAKKGFLIRIMERFAS
ncbi:hypothetical protein ACLVWU_14380 [Bdellovibrio sp. HCB290]|uniref:hypothetical protein n=1 Tax=Bdellovibrio sp. HCB290 TaxID=3394356 RepID=UPI0039B4B71C